MTPPRGLCAACPHCESVFRLEEAHLTAREGLVCCGACGEIFNAKWHLTDAVECGLPEYSRDVDVDAESPPQIAERSPAEWGRAAELSEPSEEPEFSEPPTPLDRSDPTRPRSRRKAKDAEHYITPPSGRLRKVWWAAAIALAVLLGWQIKDTPMEKTLGHADYRAVLSAACEFFHCQLPPRGDLRRLTLTHTRIDLHPGEPGALRVTVKLVNEATFAQPYPRLQLTFSDRNGRVVGRRTFPPARYLEAGTSGVLDSGELGVVRFDLARPHEKAVGFEVNIVAFVASS